MDNELNNGSPAQYDPLPDRVRKGRGSVSNRTGRFESVTHQATDDGWLLEEDDHPSANRVETTLTAESPKSVITRNKSPDVPFDRSINPYRGCEHGCIYCFARPTHAYHGFSPGLDFETKLFWKPDAPALLRKELSKKGYEPAPIAFGTNTDPYQPVEKKTRLTRQLLEVLAEFRHPFTIVTKNALVLRDLDIIAPMAKAGLARVGLSVTTLDRRLANRMEPRATTPEKRLAVLRTLSGAGVRTFALIAPVIPALNDHEIDDLVEAVAETGVEAAGFVLLRLPLELGDLFEEWLQAHYPDRAKHVLSLVRQTRDGKLYNAGWGTRMRGGGPYADLIAQRFDAALRRNGLMDRASGLAARGDKGLDVARFQVPPKPGDQLKLF